MKNIFKKITQVMNSISSTVQSPANFVKKKFERRRFTREIIKEADNIETTDFNKGSVEQVTTTPNPASIHDNGNEVMEEKADSLLQPVNRMPGDMAKEGSNNEDNAGEDEEDDIDSLLQPVNQMPDEIEGEGDDEADDKSNVSEEEVDSLLQPMNNQPGETSDEVKDDDDDLDLDSLFTSESDLPDDEIEEIDSAEEHTYTVVRIGDLSSEDGERIEMVEKVEKIENISVLKEDTDEEKKSEDVFSNINNNQDTAPENNQEADNSNKEDDDSNKEENSDEDVFASLFGTSKSEELTAREVFILSLPSITVQDLLDEANNLTSMIYQWRQD